MRNRNIILAQIAVMIFWMGSAAHSADTQASDSINSSKIAIITNASDGEIRNYKIDVVTKGKIPMPQSREPVAIDTKVSLNIQYKYGVRGSDGKFPLDVNVTNAQIFSDGQKVETTPETYPKLTILLDRNWTVNNISGLSGTRYAQSLPGINYGNMIILFYLHGADVPRLPGEKWTSKVTLPTYNETYLFLNKLTSERDVDGTKVAEVHQKISWTPKQEDFPGAVVTAEADSLFDISNGKLIKSHIDSVVTFGTERDKLTDKSSSQQDKNQCASNTKIDIVLIK